MNYAHHKTARHVVAARLWAALLLAIFSEGTALHGQQAQGSLVTPGEASTDSQTPGATQIDRVVAIVNDDLILESDVDEERRFVIFQPYSTPVGAFSRSDAIKRLTDRTLIIQQARLQPQKPITDAEVTANLNDLRKDILACKQYKCDTPQGWQSFLAANGFTEAELMLRWRERMETLEFIENRFRGGIRISDDDVKSFYTKNLLPQYAARNATAPTLDSISDRIHEILLQQQVSGLLEDWLKALRASGSVRMVTTAEASQ